MRTDPPTTVLPRIGGYTVVRRLGSGGMGEVYLARHPRLPRLDAVKVLRAQPAPSTPETLARFHQEAGILARLTHPNIVEVYDRGEADGRPWIAMEYVAGVSAGEISRRGPLPPAVALTVLRAVASALDYAWTRHRVVHRDVKPDNVLLVGDGHSIAQVKVADFGIAKTIDRPAGITAFGMTVGTVGYAAPEVLTAEGCDHRSDQYSLAATAHTLLTGAPPFRGARTAVLAAQLAEAIPPLPRTLPPRTAAVLHRGLAADPAARYPSSGALVADLVRALAPRPATPPRPVPRTVGASPAATARKPVQRTAPVRRSRRGRRLALAGAVCAAAGAALVGLAVAAPPESRTATSGGAGAPSSAAPVPAGPTVPDLRGLLPEEAAERAAEADLSLRVQAGTGSGVVVGQSPEPGVRAPGGEVDVWLG
ncbi:serine/threonine-protein kinase [Tsukamurella sp. 1534]|uniref:serine/threonine-protein kinase n=1 Tax=Tsukamurella sp. 1534 TaxID=1151061 RepID=UPI0011D1C197|nr:serine/threonine-protein kinase [Tsukamurella sp. 1534]